MEKEKSLIKVFTGPEASATLLKGRLDEIGISALIKNDSSDSFLVVAPQAVDLYIQEMDYEMALPLITDFNKGMH